MYKNIGTGPTPSPYFSVKWEAGQSRLLINMDGLSRTYSNLDEATSTQSSTSAGESTGGPRAPRVPPSIGSNRALQGVDSKGVYLVDSDNADEFTAEDDCLSKRERHKLERQASLAARKNARLARRRRRDVARYDRWVLKQLGVRKRDENSSMTLEQYEEYYVNPTNKRYPWRWVETEDRSTPLHESSIQSNALSEEIGDNPGDEASTLNYGKCVSG